MIKYEDYRNDKNFKIESLSFKQIFLGLKPALEKAISDFEKIDSKEFSLIDMDCSMRNAYAKDKDLYPLLTVGLCVSFKNISPIFKRYYYCEINPFEVKLLANYYGEVEVVESEDLNQALITFMFKNFPNSDYIQKREKYFEIAEIMRKTEENMLNL